MKQNIFVLSTNGESKLYKSINGMFYWQKEPVIDLDIRGKNYHIYITNDEEIKEWFIVNGTNGYSQPMKYSKMFLKDKFPNGHNKDILKLLSIILTTDQDLIKDGIQAIDDEFLEWFVKNSSCEFVEVKRNYLGSKCLKCGFLENHDEVDTEYCLKCHNTTYEHLYNNKIIIPQEELKDVVLGYKTSLDAQMLDKVGLEEPKQIKCYCGHTIICDCEPLEVKQETLEEGFEKYANKEASNLTPTVEEVAKSSFIEGANWMSKTLYSEEEVKRLCSKAWLKTPNNINILEEFNKWFEQHKKK